MEESLSSFGRKGEAILAHIRTYLAAWNEDPASYHYQHLWENVYLPCNRRVLLDKRRRHEGGGETPSK